MKCLPDGRAFQHAPEPMGLICWLQKGVIAENVRMLSFDDILDLTDGFAGDFANTLDMVRDE